MLYEDFWACQGNWTKSTIYRTMSNSFQNKRRGKRRWLTRKQLLPHFDNDESVVDGIIDRKMNDAELRKNEIRSHPENAKLEQYLVLVEDEEEATETDKILDRFSLKESSRGDSSSDADDSEDDGDDGDASQDSDCKGGKGKDSKKGKGSKKDKKEKAIQSFLNCYSFILSD